MLAQTKTNIEHEKMFVITRVHSKQPVDNDFLDMSNSRIDLNVLSEIRISPFHTNCVKSYNLVKSNFCSLCVLDYLPTKINIRC